MTYHHTHKSRLILSSLLLAGAVSFLPSAAQATKKVYAPYVEEGELEIELKGSYAIDRDRNEDGEQKNKFAVGYGVTDFWFSEAQLELEKSGASGADYEFEALEWENVFQLTEQGEYWLDAGLYTEYAVGLAAGKSDKVEGKLLLAKTTQNFTHLANFTLERQVGEYRSDGTEWGLAWSSRYNYTPWLEPGIEIHSEFGEISHTETYAEQQHQIGPVIYGELPYGFKYDIGYLFGASDAAKNGELKWIIEYEMYF